MENQQSTNWVILLDNEQSEAYIHGKLKYMRFPRELFDDKFKGFKGVTLRHPSDILSAPSFVCRRDQTFEDSGTESYELVVGEGYEFILESYIARWNKKFPDYQYSPDLETTIVELSENI